MCTTRAAERWNLAGVSWVEKMIILFFFDLFHMFLMATSNDYLIHERRYRRR